MTKTFKAPEGYERELTVQRVGTVAWVRVHDTRRDEVLQTLIPQEDIPAAALALLECIDLPDIPEYGAWESAADGAMDCLRQAVGIIEADKAAASDAAKLEEEEALRLFNAHVEYNWGDPFDSWDGVPTETKDHWIVISKAARALHQEDGE